MNEKFTRRIFTPGILLRDIGFLVGKAPQIIAALQNKEIDKAFIEKIMTVTTAVNGCTYCAWFHAKQAVASGIPEEEVKEMLSLQFKTNASDFETTALLYAQHFAETNRTPDKEMTKRLFDYYGEEMAAQIILFIRMIFFGNLMGNTWDAVLSRLRGSPAENSNIFFEIAFFLLAFFVMFPAMIATREKKEPEALCS